MKRAFLLILISLFHPQEERISVRIIAVRTEAEAAAVRTQLQSGRQFESLAREHSVDASSSAGGYMGTFRMTDLRPEFQRALAKLSAGQINPVTPIGNQFFLFQRLSIEEASWIDSN